ncbi:Spy/CpxP family protein refolding chaperone [Funiculus sociatus]|jgi:Spy/CpxP family protein refolding chaperone|uniref:Spy/CpxP family protein refolding chaperone n=1 Tax=Funiculus sociatus TaxID=450527 RepID=UPI003296F56B
MSLSRVSLVALLMLSVGSSAAFAAPMLLPQTVAQTPGDTSPQPQRRKNRDSFLKELNLTPQQMQQMQAMQARYKPQISQRAQAMRQAKQELASLMSSTTASTSQITAKNQQVEQLAQQIRQLKFESMMAMREIMTPEQRTKFAQLMQQRRQNHQNRAGKRNAQ